MTDLSRRAAIFALAAGAVPAAAHRGHSALSVVEFDARTGVVTVSHRFQTHDAEPALAVIAPDAQTSLDDPDAVKALTAYVDANFTVTIKGSDVDLVLKDMTLALTKCGWSIRAKCPRLTCWARSTSKP